MRVPSWEMTKLMMVPSDSLAVLMDCRAREHFGARREAVGQRMLPSASVETDFSMRRRRVASVLAPSIDRTCALRLL
jgi:hypothetical protein